MPAAELGELTDGEREIVALVGEGLSNQEIATRLFVSPATAKTHVSRAMSKLRARDRAQLVVIAYESAWCDRDGPADLTNTRRRACGRPLLGSIDVAAEGATGR